MIASWPFIDGSCRSISVTSGLWRWNCSTASAPLLGFEGLRRARRLLDRYEELWRGRLDRMAALVTDTKETDP